MTELEKWKNDFKEFISELSMPRDDYKGIMEYINEIPSVELKTGVWQESTIPERYVTHRCSNCGYGVKRLDLYSYCPNCGARMVSE